jgi:hypothetical protein
MLQFGLLLRDYGSPVELEEAADVLDCVARSEGASAIAAGQALAQLYRRLGRTSDAVRMNTRVAELQQTVLATAHDRFTLRSSDVFEPVHLAPPFQEQLVAWLTAQPDIGRAFLVRKRRHHLEDNFLVVLAIQRKVAWYKLETVREASELCNRALRHFLVDDHTDRMVTIVESHSRILRILRSMPTCVLLDRIQGDTWRIWLVSSWRAGRKLSRLALRYRWGLFGILIALVMSRGCGGIHP